MKKILFHINSMGKGGAERVVAVLAKYFANDDYDVVVTTLWKADDEYELDKKVRRISVGLSELEEKKNRVEKIFLRIAKYRNVLKKEKPDIVISFCNKANFRSAYALTGIKIPLLVSVRNAPQIDYAPYKFATKYMQKKASGCVFQTTQAKEFFDRSFQNKSKIIWNPLSEKFIGKEIDTIEIKERKNVIVTVGRITKQKNQKLLIKAFSNIKNRYPDYQLWIFGEDSKDGTKEELDKIISENKLENRVIFKGLSDNISKDIKYASVFVLPSDYEGMPNALLEAMAIGLPVISTDCPCGGPDMMIDNGVSGLLVPVNDVEALQKALIKVLDNRNSAENMGKKAKDIIKVSHPDFVYSEWKQYVNKLIEQKGL